MLSIRWKSVLAALMMVAAFAVPAQAQSGATLIRDAEIERTLKRLSTPIFRAAGLPPETIQIYIIQNNRMNAFVAGGRNIFLFTGLLMDLETPEELLGVIAHETGHIAGGHEARRRINLRNARGPALIGMLAGIAVGIAGGGEAGAALAAGSQGALMRSILRNSRAEEASADQAGISYLLRAGIDPEGFRSVLRRFRGQEVLSVGNVDPYVLTHPLGTERMSLVDRRIDEVSGRTWASDPEREYWHARMRAKLRGYLEARRTLDDLAGQPETEINLYAKAIALFRQSFFDDAIGAVDRLIAKKPSDPFYIELKGQILYEAGRSREAVEALRQAVRLAPEEPLIKALLGRALLQQDTDAANAEALQILRDARADDLADAAALRDLALAYDRAGQRGMATLATAERYALAGRTEDAVGLARRAAAILPVGSPSWLRAQDILKLEPPEE